MNKIAIMQPYFFPYIGYYQLINSVDTFVLYDDVNFIMKGYINRNKILLNDKPHQFSISLDKASQNKLICDTKLNFSLKDKESFLKTFSMAYKKASFFNAFYPILEEIIFFDTKDLTDFIHNSFLKTFEYLTLEKHFIRSSQIENNKQLAAEKKILDICKRLETTVYINPIGGMGLYHEQNFLDNNIELRFINTLSEKVAYQQFKNDFVANLSFLDVLMFNSIEEIKDMLEQHVLLRGVMG